MPTKEPLLHKMKLLPPKMNNTHPINRLKPNLEMKPHKNLFANGSSKITVWITSKITKQRMASIDNRIVTTRYGFFIQLLFYIILTSNRQKVRLKIKCVYQFD